MPRNFSVAAILEKNKVSSVNPYVICMELEIPDNDSIFVTNNSEDVVIDADTYTAFPFTVDAVEVSTDGGHQEIEVAVANVRHLLTSQIVETEGLRGAKAYIRVVSLVRDEFDVWNSEVVIEEEFLVNQTTVTEEVVTIKLGVENILQKRFPPRVYLISQFPGIPNS